MMWASNIKIGRRMDEQQHQRIVVAADFFNQTARKFLTVDGRLHAETLILSAARMAGSLMYRSFNFDPSWKPGTAVLSDLANIHGPKLMNVMFVTLQQLGSSVTEAQLDSSYASAQFSQLDFKASHDKLAPFFLAYSEAGKMKFEDAAAGAAIATAILIHDCREVLSVEKGGALAVYGFVEGTKTVPYPLPGPDSTAHAPAAAPEKKPWYKVG
jgi:hypothetical protein